MMSVVDQCSECIRYKDGLCEKTGKAVDSDHWCEDFDYDHGDPPWRMCMCGRQSNFEAYQKNGCPHCGRNTPEWFEEQKRVREEKQKRYDEIREKMKVEQFEKAKQEMPDYAFMLIDYYISRIGKQGWMVTCSECGEYFRLYVWSFRGNGSKKCPGCGYKHHNIYKQGLGKKGIDYRGLRMNREKEAEYQ